MGTSRLSQLGGYWASPKSKCEVKSEATCRVPVAKCDLMFPLGVFFHISSCHSIADQSNLQLTIKVSVGPAVQGGFAPESLGTHPFYLSLHSRLCTDSTFARPRLTGCLLLLYNVVSCSDARTRGSKQISGV